MPIEIKKILYEKETNDSPVAIHIFDTITDSMTQITPVDYSDTYNSAGLMFWVSGIMNGDVKDDGLLNMLDIVSIVNMILTGKSNSEADYNGDSTVYILDILQIVNYILAN